jgi:hypothetical protein
MIGCNVVIKGFSASIRAFFSSDELNFAILKKKNPTVGLALFSNSAKVGKKNEVSGIHITKEKTPQCCTYYSI